MISRLFLSANYHLASPQAHQCISHLTIPASQLHFARSRFFSTTRSHYDSFINHYEILKLPQNCSQAELKKSAPTSLPSLSSHYQQNLN
jgi:hypothetical protein